MTSRRHVAAVLVAGGSAGLLDIGLRGVRPIRVLQSVASGLLGVTAFDGGMRTAALGLVFHFFIATVAAASYYLTSRRMQVLARRPFIFGPLYGIAVYVVMTFVVLPLSAVPKRPFSAGLAVVIVCVHMVCVGLPIALAVRRFGTTAEDPPRHGHTRGS